MPTPTKILRTGVPLVILLMTLAGCSGTTGDPGTPGTACWDLNENAECDVDTEDINGDGECSVADCSGDPGDPGVACWDLDGNGDCDPAAEDTDGDGACTVADCAGDPGLECWDLNANDTCDAASEDLNGDGSCTVADCSTAPLGTIEGTVVDEAGAGIGGAAVDAAPGGGSTTTDASGAFSLTVPIGVFTITASATGYTSATVEFVSVASGGVVTLDPIVLTAENPLTVDAGESQYQVGYGAAVNLTGTATGPGTLTYEWTQTAGPTAAITGADTLTPTVTLPTLDEVLTYLGGAAAGRALPDRTEILPISPGIQGKVTLQLKVSGGGFESTDTVTVSAADPTGSVLNVPVGINVFFVAADAATYAWTLTPPGTSSATLRGADTRTPSFIPDSPGTYALSLSGGPSFSVEAGEWTGYVGFESGCTGCHNGTSAPNMFPDVDATAHASIFADGIDGIASDHYGQSCLACHTVGYSGAADNGGFDDVATADGWTFPATLEAGNWDAMQTSYPNVARLGNIQCESCHGPNDSAAHMSGAPRMSMKEGMCGQCHDAPTHHAFPTEWMTTPHSNLEFARAEGAVNVTPTLPATITRNNSCGRCHGGQGYLKYVDQLDAGNAGNIYCEEPSGAWCTATTTEAEKSAFWTDLGMVDSQVEPMTCQTCHDPHNATNPNQLRVYNNVAMLPAGFGVSGVGKGALCMTCHNTRNGVFAPTTFPVSGSLVYWTHDDFSDPARLTSYSGPHTPSQTDVLMGYNAFFVGSPGYAVSGHAVLGDTCVSCHMAEPAEEGASFGRHTWRIGEGTCFGCHGEGVNGEAFMAAVEARLTELDDAIIAQLIGDLSDIVGAGGTYDVRAWNPVTDCYSSSSSSVSDVNIAQTPTSATLEHIHGQTGFCLTLPAAVSVTWGSTGCSGTESVNPVCFQLGSLKTGGTAVIATTDALVKAAWNASLILGDGSFGIHNPSFVMDVLEASYSAVINRP